MSENANKGYVIKVDNKESLDCASNDICEPQPFDNNILRASECAENLDRSDDFDFLKISLTAYNKEDNSNYGIEYNSQIHNVGGDVILPHQEKAAKDFLQHLRGFGLLADCVGSGKTFEAGIILSELACRGKIKSILFVVPSQTFASWKDVIENKFGLGVDKLRKAGDTVNSFNCKPKETEKVVCGEKKFVRPLVPIIVTTEDFAQWKESEVKELLFDAIVVDEAHHLCLESGQYAKALKLLSILMVTKKAVNIPYCILLSATPHSGNLERMFRLWYFIRCKGGMPSDFDEKEDADRTGEYNNEKKYYFQSVCKGASTVAEFIQVAKKQILEGDRASGITSRFWAGYSKFLEENGKLENYDNQTEGFRRILRDEYVLAQNLGDEISAEISKAYHNGVMRTIMIRQPNTYNRNNKHVQNYYFCPTADDIDIDNLQKFALQKSQNGNDIEITTQDCDSPLIFALDTIFDKCLCEKMNDERVFTKKQTDIYYKEQFIRSCGAKNSIRILPNNDIEENIFLSKKEQFEKVANKYGRKRIIVFFDYDKNECQEGDETWDKLAKSFKNTKIGKRIILATESDNKEDIHTRFESVDDAILLVGDKAFTEGENFQFCNIIVNFEVTKDPLAMDQRIGRVFRLGQADDVEVISFAQMNVLEGYCLAYFDAMGLLSSTNGDATIIAGSNNEHMVAIKCPACGRVELIARSDYDERKKNDQLYCISEKKCCHANVKGSRMTEINVYEFKCDNCGAELKRGTGDKGYQCLATGSSNRSKLINVIDSSVKDSDSQEKAERKYFCSKVCAIKHCGRFANNSVLKKGCAIYNSKADAEYADCVVACATCKKEIKEQCLSKCRVTSNLVGSIEQCAQCNQSQCSPKPSIIQFDENWNAVCPTCNGGHLRCVRAHTFASYIQGAYDFEGNNDSFCANMRLESKKTSEIRRILEQDKE